MRRFLYLWADLMMVAIPAIVLALIFDGRGGLWAWVSLTAGLLYWVARQWRVPA